MTAAIIAHLPAQVAIGHDAASSDEMFHAIGSGVIEEALQAAPDRRQRPAAKAGRVFPTGGDAPLALRFGPGKADLAVAAKDMGSLDGRIYRLSQLVNMDAGWKRQVQGDAHAVDELAGTDVTGAADTGDIEAFFIGHGPQQVRRPAGQMDAVERLTANMAHAAQDGEEMVFLMTQAVQGHVQDGGQGPAITEAGQESGHIRIIAAPGLVSHGNGPDMGTGQDASQPFKEDRQVARMLIDHVGLGQAAAALGDAQDDAFVGDDVISRVDEAQRRRITAGIDAEKDVHQALDLT